MDETSYIDAIIRSRRPVMIRLLEGRDISAVPIAQDRDVIIISNNNEKDTSMIYKKAISVITPTGG
jgi:sRNA-binding regulator protein Hfq